MRPAEVASSPSPPPVDHLGAATLERMAAAPRYNRWMFERLRPWVGRRVLEVGAGIGNMSAFLVDRERAVLTDTEPHYLARLRESFGDRPNVRVVELRLPAFDPHLVAERVDTVFCLNVLEHIEDDGASLAAMRQLLGPGGRLVLLVPALRPLYGTLDQALGHFRRYARGEVVGKLEAAGFRVGHVEYFNLGGVPGWWLASRVLRRPMISTAALRCYEALVPLFRLERWLPWRVGQSLIAIGEVPPP
ncbi:MAG TPA: class I SAM-dependent methyltransferase [Gemmatimonadales bacterium]|nr:class I SAM-dependent methyltransferase [Gemmatimonadales bacterium]